MAKVNFPKTDSDKAKLYLHCMLEVKQRLAAIESILNSDSIVLFRHEMCFLHLRHICEVISIACLAAQGDYDTHRAFSEGYSPPKIFKALKTPYPNFFPQPCEVVTEGKNHRLTANNKPGAYTERDITKLWNEAGNHLHRTSVSKYLATTFNAPKSLDPIVRHTKGIINLLELHVIPIQKPPRAILLQVALADGQGAVHVQFLHINTEDDTMVVEEYRGSMA